MLERGGEGGGGMAGRWWAHRAPGGAQTRRVEGRVVAHPRRLSAPAAPVPGAGVAAALRRVLPGAAALPGAELPAAAAAVRGRGAGAGLGALRGLLQVSDPACPSPAPLPAAARVVLPYSGEVPGLGGGAGVPAADPQLRAHPRVPGERAHTWASALSPGRGEAAGAAGVGTTTLPAPCPSCQRR